MDSPVRALVRALWDGGGTIGTNITQMTLLSTLITVERLADEIFVLSFDSSFSFFKLFLTLSMPQILVDSPKCGAFLQPS